MAMTKEEMKRRGLAQNSLQDWYAKSQQSPEYPGYIDAAQLDSIYRLTQDPNLQGYTAYQLLSMMPNLNPAPQVSLEGLTQGDPSYDILMSQLFPASTFKTANPWMNQPDLSSMLKLLTGATRTSRLGSGYGNMGPDILKRLIAGVTPAQESLTMATKPDYTCDKWWLNLANLGLPQGASTAAWRNPEYTPPKKKTK